ncbi:hypothetical protein [Christiangramia forsetii]|uniref:Uncharacterized protein n=2 Tax=Christiangramia forsetii TaxID=411153 RepID=A0M2K5_CHRFK|nr:hypothetical protein [Christiangramia forsetii]GGG38873.1 hypothetical protein GCM10011532_23310 [Christiangramia forsetii]CAL66850.1 conserved hypothetical protein [Christiangramia forsetii KT0803]
MRRLFFSIFSLALLSACDDGEIIVTSFDFEDSSVQFCEGPNKNVFYSVNNNDVFESISLEFRKNLVSLDEEGNLEPPEEDEGISFDLTGDSSTDNRIVYRIFNSEVPSDYFCNVVPPKEPAVVEEWISGTGATVFITTSFGDESPNVDVDGDGLNNIDEGWDPDGIDHLDTDEDGIPDYLDVDDDGDNIETRRERETEPADEDGIPNYLDNDDDDDGVLTRFEVQEGNEDNPTLFQTAEGISNYLNAAQTAELQHDVYIDHDITRSYGYRIIVEDLKFTKQDGSGESIQYQSYDFGNYSESGINIILCPSQDTNCGDTPDETDPDETEETN